MRQRAGAPSIHIRRAGALFIDIRRAGARVGNIGRAGTPFGAARPWGQDRAGTVGIGARRTGGHNVCGVVPVTGQVAGATSGAGLFPEVQAFVQQVKVAASLAEISALLSAATRAFAFDHFAMTQRFGMRIEGAPVQLTDFPRDWIELLGETGLWANDPVLAACHKTVAPFVWDDLPTLIALTPGQQSYMRVAAGQGLARGWTVPIHIPGEATGLCSFVVANGRVLPHENLPAAQYLACFAFEAARRLAARSAPPGPRLTRRQLECVVLAARGKSDWVTGQLLGLAPDTVHKYLEQAKARYGVASRTELVVRALYDGQVSFGDVLG